MTNHVIDTYVKNFLTYRYKDWYWVINPSTNEWVVSVGNTGYTFFNNKFWRRLFANKNLITSSL